MKKVVKSFNYIHQELCAARGALSWSEKGNQYWELKRRK